jgi:hypothetical protein
VFRARRRPAISIVTLKWLSPPSRAPAWPECRAESSTDLEPDGLEGGLQLVLDGVKYGAHFCDSSILFGSFSPHTWPMPGAFQYKPKFVDIACGPHVEKDDSEHDVNALKPGERACDHRAAGWSRPARAPKARDMLHEHYWFCQPHAAEYNRNWNFFAGLSTPRSASARPRS